MPNTEFNNVPFDLPRNNSNVIKVIGVGGGGSNAVNHMYSLGIKGVDFVVCNTDAQALQNSPIPNKIQLGVSLTEGLGAGANPEVGEEAAMESIQEIKDMLSTNSKMVFITVGMGGGTGTGAAPVIAKVARELDLLTIGIVTKPFSFEGKTRNEQAQLGIDKLRSFVDSLVVINNNKLREVYGNLGFKAGFSKADEVLATAARGIAEVITHHYTQNIDLRDAKTVLANSGTAIMGSSVASGQGRSEEAISKALDSPLLNDNKIIGAKNVLLLIVSGKEEVTIDEIGEINEFIQNEAKSEVNIIMGVGEDETLGDAISVTVIATGFNKDQQNEITNSEPKVIRHTLETEQQSTFDLSDNKLTPITESKETPIQSAPVTPPKAEAPKKVVHDLGAFEEEEEDEFRLIPTTEFIKDIDVVYDEISYEVLDDFVINEVIPQVQIDEVQEPVQEYISEEQQTALTFDMEISKQPEIMQEMTQAEINKIEVVHEEVTPIKRKEEKIVFALEDYEQLEETLSMAKKEPAAEVKEEVLEEEMEIKLKTKPAEVNPIHTPINPQAINEIEVNDAKEISPLNGTIAELRSTAQARREKMKDLNHKFGNKISNNIDEIEKIPAYKRSGLDLDNHILHSSDTNQSRTSLEIDDEEGIQLRSNNSFLHDNVD